MIAFLIAQWINTQYSQKNLHHYKKLAGENSSAVNITGEPPVDGDIVVTYDRIKGYLFTNENRSLWGPDIFAGYICGEGNRNKDGIFSNRSYFSVEPRYSTREVFSLAGLALLVAMTFVFVCAITGIWPTIFRLQRSVDIIAEEVENNGEVLEAMAEKMGIVKEHNEEEEAAALEKRTRENRKIIAAYIWLVVSLFALTFFCAIASHMICASFGWPTIIGKEKSGWCYRVDQSQLAQTTSASRRLRGDEAANFTEKPRADVVLHKDGSVDLVTNCEASLLDTTTGAVWDIVPEYQPVCKDTPAYTIKDVEPDEQKRCSFLIIGGSWGPKDVTEGTRPGYTNSASYDDVRTTRKCGFANLGTEHWRGWQSWLITSYDHWQFCNLEKQTAYLRRRDTDGKVEDDIKFTKILTVDPLMSRPYGWYTTGAQEVIPDQYFSDGTGGPILFKTPDNWQEYIEQYYNKPLPNGEFWRYNVPDLNTRPNSFECRSLITIPDGNKFVEFQEPCKAIMVSITKDDPPVQRFSTTDELFCTVELGFQDDHKYTTVISVNRLRPVTVNGADRWKCRTEGAFGYDCGEDVPMTMLDPEIVNATISTVIGVTNWDTKPQLDIGLIEGIKFPKLIDTSNIKSIISTIVGVVAGIAVICIVVWLVKTFVTRRRERREAAAAQPIVIQQPAQPHTVTSPRPASGKDYVAV
jgi:hypothetical protein